MNTKLHGHTVQDLSANELQADIQTSRGHNSAPQATLTPRLELNRSPQPGEHNCTKHRLFDAAHTML